MSRIRVTEGGFGKKKPDSTGGANTKKKLGIAMQLAQLNRIRFSLDSIKEEKSFEFFGYIPKEEHRIEFYFFADPEVKKDKIEMKYTLAEGDLGVIRMKGGSQFMFTGREKDTEEFRIIAKAKLDGREIDFKDSKAEKGKITLCFKDESTPQEYEALL